MGRLGSLLMLVAACGFVLHAAPAFAVAPSWNIGKSTNGVVISRSPENTSTANVQVYLYWDYKGGDSWSSSLVPNWTSSYNKGDASPRVTLDGGNAEAIEIDFVPGYRCQLVQVAQGSNWSSFAAVNDRLAVALPQNQAVAVSSVPSVAISTMPSVSLAGTSTVSLSESESEYLRLAGAGAALCAAVGFGAFGHRLVAG